MRLGDVVNADAARYGKPLDGVRVLAIDQMKVLPWGTQLLARLGADVVKVEHPTKGDMGRSSTPAMSDPEGRRVGATFLRNNLNKRTISVDLKHPEGRDLILQLAPRFDVFAENFKAGFLRRIGLGYDDIAAVHPGCIYVSVSGFGNTVPTPYADWPAYAAVGEAMSGIYEFKREGDNPPVAAPVGGLGDIGSAQFAVIGVFAALRQREKTGEGQYIDIAMLDAMVSMTDLVTNFWSLGLRNGQLGPMIMHGFKAGDGWFIMQIGREHEFERLANLIGTPEWLTDARLATRDGWMEYLDSMIRPAVEKWASTRTKVEACRDLGSAGIASGPCFRDDEVVVDPHVAARDMLVEMDRTDGVEQPVLIPGNPVRMSKVAQGPETRVPWHGEHTDEILGAELGLSAADLAKLREAGAIG